MTDYYYQIKGKRSGQDKTWSWPPIFSGLISAADKKAAKVKVEKDYGKQFPLRVLRKDIDDNEYLLHLREVDIDDDKTRSLFDLKVCTCCGKNFRQIDLYNDLNELYKGDLFCSSACRCNWVERNKVTASDNTGNGKPVIYKVTNIKTGMSYVGKTTQVFTLRWYQHFYQTGSCKFHQAIVDSNLEDWQFSVIEAVSVKQGLDVASVLAEREQHWITKLNTINNGYNSVGGKQKRDEHND